MAIELPNPLGTRQGFSAVGNSQGKVESLAVTVIGWMTIIAGVVAVAFLVYYGIMFITSGGDPEKATKARTGIIYAIIGIIVITAAYFIVSFAMGVGNTLDTAN